MYKIFVIDPVNRIFTVILAFLSGITFGLAFLSDPIYFSFLIIVGIMLVVLCLLTYKFTLREVELVDQNE